LERQILEIFQHLLLAIAEMHQNVLQVLVLVLEHIGLEHELLQQTVDFVLGKCQLLQLDEDRGPVGRQLLALVSQMLQLLHGAPQMRVVQYLISNLSCYLAHLDIAETSGRSVFGGGDTMPHRSILDFAISSHGVEEQPREIIA
jgi:hypothetical protein